MTPSDWALVISICSAFISLLSLDWNILSKFIYPKPILVVGFTLQQILDDNELHGPFLSISATNHGPVACTVTHSFVLMHKGLFRRPGIGLLNPLSNFPFDFQATRGPFSGGLPKKIEWVKNFP
jgi:hypothetical protein